jgi:hypothetical protein
MYNPQEADSENKKIWVDYLYKPGELQKLVDYSGEDNFSKRQGLSNL